ncbi:MAG: DUF5060 domain-containing protein [Phycisphaerae bacterium]|nr:DUF5060 domain-containing protein [Phycisphaerae bacterium]MDW8263496.1 DUF5060 domain-containing protein [Phycisphaerales bacterium]
MPQNRRDGRAGGPANRCLTCASPAVEQLEPRRLLASVSGAMAQFQAVTLSFSGPRASQHQNNPNPFLDYRLQVNVTSPSGKTYSIPGFFNGDGNGGATGNVWQAKFAPDEVGTWRYTASFRQGPRVAIDLSPSAGSAAAFDGETGTFVIRGRQASAPGFTGKGRLQPWGYYYRFQDGTPFVKVGANEPENFLGYVGFNNTPNGWHKYQPHIADWKPGDPDWGGGRGRAIIGAVNYLASTGINALYFLTQNVGGQTKDVWPWAGNINRFGSPANDNLHYDLGKLAQWDIVFNHMQRKGIMLHFVFAETEEATKKELDNATLGTERKLYYRELIARFGYHNALQWNINEEYCWRYPIAPDEIRKWAQYIRDVDPFDRPLTVHSQGYQERTWGYFVGDKRFDAASLQYYKYPPGNEVARHGGAVEYWRNRTAAAGRPIVIALDEARETSETNQTAQRKELLWHTLLSGGHLEWSTTTFAWNDNLRRYDSINRASGHALKFMNSIPFHLMQPADTLVAGESGTYGGAQVLAKANDIYAIYFPNATSTGTINLAGATGSFVARWYNPRTGAFEGSSRTFLGGGSRAIGAPPASPGEDWALLIRRTAPVLAARPATPTFSSQPVAAAMKSDVPEPVLS